MTATTLAPRRILGRTLSTTVFLALSVAVLPARAAPGELALERVMLSSGGVGYFEYAAEIEGDAELAFKVNLDQVDDVLKSIVVYDDAGVSSASGPNGRSRNTWVKGSRPGKRTWPTPPASS